MLVEVKVPQLSESVAEATLVSWHKKAGEYVKRDENLVDIETDKVVLETPAPQAGVLVKIVKTDGSTVTSNEIIATIDTEAKPAAGNAEAAAVPVAAAAPARAAVAGVPAMPAAQKLAAEKNIDTASLSGSGRGGRVTKGDVLQAAQGGGKTPVPAAGAASTRVMPTVDLGDLGERPAQRVPMSRLRARIAERLVQSQSTAAILTTFNEVNM
ncbi:MAG: 2-oxoglutarate dehydrogenase complex dihydrolipoamide succinyltransferase, partial [Proteobacteria bacterium]|nr:2-oxoglutarate dehydrogenase complex dihydrolipoamide succinyltransferase [Pseudomonadota bacterium]